MSRRVLAVTAALVLALVGALIVLGYAAGADRRAMASLEPVDVLVALETVPAGTPVESLEGLVAVETVPARAVGPGALTSLEAVSGQITGSVLLPGEQLLETRFADPASLTDATVIPVPADMHEVSIQLDGPRALGGKVQAGDTVGVVMSLNSDLPHTQLTYHQVLVTRVQGGLTDPLPQPAPEDPAAQTSPPAPTPDPLPGGAVMVSLAVTTEQVEEIVFAAEYERIWLTREGPDVPAEPTETVTGENLWKDHGAHTHEETP